jgi:paraquat-inducible protein B
MQAVVNPVNGFLKEQNKTVRGLKAGNAVEFGGVSVGSVKDIKIMYDVKAHSTSVPVYMEIQAGVLTDAGLKRISPVKSGKNGTASCASLSTRV